MKKSKKQTQATHAAPASSAEPTTAAELAVMIENGDDAEVEARIQT